MEVYIGICFWEKSVNRKNIYKWYIHIVNPWTTKGLRPLCSKKFVPNFWLQKKLTAVVSSIWEGYALGPPAYVQIHKCSDPYVKWPRTMHTVGALQPWIPNFESKIFFSIAIIWICGYETGDMESQLYIWGGNV